MKNAVQISSTERQRRQEQSRRARDTNEASKRTGYSPSALAQLRMKGGGPRYYKLSPGRRGKVIYYDDDLDEWMETKAVDSTSEY